MRFELTPKEAAAGLALRIDGRVPDPVPTLTWTDAIGMPFTAIYLDGQRQYDVELWIDGTLRHTVPPKSPEVDAVYDRLEAGNRGEPLPAVDIPKTGTPEDRQTRRQRVEAELLVHPGRVAYIRWQALRRTSDVNARNASELLGLLHGVATDPAAALELMQNVRPPDVADEINAQIDQRLHNYVPRRPALSTTPGTSSSTTRAGTLLPSTSPAKSCWRRSRSTASSATCGTTHCTGACRGLATRSRSPVRARTSPRRRTWARRNCARGTAGKRPRRRSFAKQATPLTRRRRPDIDPVLGLVTSRRAGSARKHGRFELPSGAFVLTPGVASPGAMTVREAVDQVVADWERQAALGNVSGLTVEKFSPAVLRFAGYAAAAGVATLADVDGDLCWRWCTAKESTGFRFGQDRRIEPCSPKTSRARKATLRAFFVTCQALGLDDRDPSLTVTLPPLPVYRLFRPLTVQEAERVRKASHCRVGETRFPATVGLALCGVSTAESAAVRVRDCYPQAQRVWAHGGGTRTAARWVALDPWAASTIAAQVAHLAGRTPPADLPDTLLVYTPRKAETRPERRQAAVGMQVARVLRLAGLGDTPGVRPAALVEYAAMQVFARTSSVPAVAAALGMASLDATAELIGHDWRAVHRVEGPAGVPAPTTPVSYAGVPHPGLDQTAAAGDTDGDGVEP